MKPLFQKAKWFVSILVGCMLFAIGFNLFLRPNELNIGDISGLAMILTHLLGRGSIGVIAVLVNLPLFAIAGLKIGKKFFFGSLVGMLLSSTALDAFSFLPAVQVEPLVAALYGGALCGLGVGLVFLAGASTGGSDIIIRLLKMRWQHIPIGTITIAFDLCIAALTGITFDNVASALYSGVAIFVTGQVMDAVVYRFDYSKVVLIVSDRYDAVAHVVQKDLNRGATYLQGEGAYSHQQKKVILTVVKRQQIAELKRLVVEVDPNAFIVVQDAHQVLGEGFARYSKDAL